MVFGPSDTNQLLPEISFHADTESLSVADLIARTVALQVSVLQSNGQHTISEIRAVLEQLYLDEQGLAEQQSASLFEEPVNHIVKLDIDLQFVVERAQRAFEQQRYFIFVNGKQTGGLQETLQSAELIDVKFMRLNPQS